MEQGFNCNKTESPFVWYKNKNPPTHIFAWANINGLFSWSHEIKALPLFYSTLETFILALQHRSLGTDVRDFLIVRPVDAGRTIVGGRFLSRLLVEETGRAEIQWKLTCKSYSCMSQVQLFSPWLMDPLLSAKQALSFFLWNGINTPTCQRWQQRGEGGQLPVFIVSHDPAGWSVAELNVTPAIWSQRSSRV